MTQTASRAILAALAGAIIAQYGCEFTPGDRTVQKSEDFRPPSRASEAGLVNNVKVVPGKPLTVEVTLSEQVRKELTAALDAAPPHSVKLTLGELVPPKVKPKPVRGLDVYVNLPSEHDAAELSPESMYWVGAIEFAQTNQPQGFNLDLARPLDALRRDNKWSPNLPIRITLIAVPTDAAVETPKDWSIPIKKVTISVPANEREK